MHKSAYSIKSVSVDAVISCVLGGFAILCILGAIFASYMYKGEGPAVVGLLGIASLMSAISGIGFSVAAWKTQDGGFLMKRIAMIINVLPLLVVVILYILGWVVA